MSDKTAIGWTDATDNIHRAKRGGWWCRKVSPECDHCYAEQVNDSDYFKGNHLPYSGTPPELVLREDIINGWARKKKHKRRFVESMSDVFGEWLPRAWIFRMLDGMLAAPGQTFQMLTKRPAIARREIMAWLAERGLEELPAHMWIGVTAGCQATANAFVPILIQIPAAVRFVSCEPLLTLVDLSLWLHAVQWVIVGGESGSNARPMHPEWARFLLQQCIAAGVKFFFKQWGEWAPSENVVRQRGTVSVAHWFDGRWDIDVENLAATDGHRDDEPTLYRIGKYAAGDLFDGQRWNAFPDEAAA